MVRERLLVALVVCNGLLLLTAMTEGHNRDGQEAPTVVRARAIELLDQQGRVRSRINVEPDGEVLLRLFDEEGTIRVKLGAGHEGSGLVLLDDATEPGVQILAKAAGSSIRLRSPTGTERVIQP